MTSLPQSSVINSVATQDDVGATGQKGDVKDSTIADAQDGQVNGKTNASEISAVKENSEELVKNGEKSLANKRFDEAVDILSKATEQLTTELGSELFPSALLARSLLLYGRALLQLHVSTSSALGQTTSTSEPVVTEKNSSTTSTNPKFQIAELEDEEEAGDDEEEDGEGEEEEEDDLLETSFGVLEQSRIVWKKLIDGDGQESIGKGKRKAGEQDEELKKHYNLQLSFTHELIGEVHLENGNFEPALKEYRDSLAIMETFLDPDDRMLASTNYMISLCLDSGWTEKEKKEEALFHTESALRVLQRRLKGLQDTKDSNTPSSTKQNSEITEIEGMIKEMELKIEDLKLMINEPPSEQAPLLPSERAVKELLEKSSLVNGTTNEGKGIVPLLGQVGEVKDLSKMGLIKRKSKFTDTTSQSATQTNQSPFAFVTSLMNNGNANVTSNGQMNGKRKQEDDMDDYEREGKKVRLSEEE